MIATDELLTLTAGDLMSRQVKTVRDDAPLGEAARDLARWGLRGAPVVDAAGRCVGVLSVSDLARWAAARDRPGPPLPVTCSLRLVDREPGGRETVLCLLAGGLCPFQRPGTAADGTRVNVCGEPHTVPTDWQMVELEAVPTLARDVMTTEVVAAGPDTPVAGLARAMLDRGVHRLFVLDPDRHPVGVVAADDLLQVLANAGPDRGDH